MQPCSPIKLSVSLNLSVFYYEVVGDNEKACNIANSALSAALEKIDELGEEAFMQPYKLRLYSTENPL